MSATAYCDANGVVGFQEGRDVPDGMLPVFRARTMKRAVEIAETVCRHAYDGRALLVPGVPEAAGRFAAVDALIAFRGWISNRRGVTV